jgi:hypothetical protein
MNDIYAFIVDNPSMTRANWMPCREYQAWAHRDFMYDTHRSTKKSYPQLKFELIIEKHGIALAFQIGKIRGYGRVYLLLQLLKNSPLH